MPKGKQIDTAILLEFVRRMKSASKKERGEALRWFMELTDVSKNTAYAMRARMLKGQSYVEVAGGVQRRKPRKSEFQRATETKHALAVSAIKRRAGEDKKWASTARALRIAEHMGNIPTGLYTRSKMDRLLSREGLNRASARKLPMAHELIARYPGHVIAVDATVMDQYYIKLDKNVEHYNAPAGDQHLDDYLRKNMLSKIWVYYGVDMYSKAFLPLPFIPTRMSDTAKNGGENAFDWLTFLKFFILPKSLMRPILEDRKPPLRECPIEGIPTILYCDAGSGIGRSLEVGGFCASIGTEIITHMPGNPSAKGIVESRIGAFKRSYESIINPAVITNINQLINFYLEWANYHNRMMGFYDAWQRGAVSYPVLRVSEHDLSSAMVSHFTRTINGYGCVESDNAEWFVTWDEKYRGTKATIYRPRTRDGVVKYSAVLSDGTVIQKLAEGRKQHDIDDIKSFPVSAGRKNREIARLLAKELGKQMIYDDILPPKEETNIVRMPSQTKQVEIHSPLVPDQFESADKAWQWILNQTQRTYEDIGAAARATIDNGFNLAMKEYGFVPSEMAVVYANLLIKYKAKEMNNA